ncbi:chitin synthase III catalytic subunit [Leucosporidium creatinivorum]|uniref:Chitin synthase export chaperone n=1 Tax=Leucosporidium creatinivorum TaxID=106004 RepID=A0A1Y2EGQ5_9BASI|nr:chitin synthase III catalytic subunit [Leucosporidium creatinivorum]
MATIETSLSFGSYDWICSQAALIVCPLVGSSTSGGYGIAPTCYSRNVELGKTLIFQPATAILHICALGMVAIMILHIRTKYTAVGRKEIVQFFYMYFVVELLGIFLDSGIIPSYSKVYAWFAAIHTGLSCATYWCLLLNGFVGFQFAEDGTPVSLWSLRISSLIVFFLTGFFAIATFLNLASFSSQKPTALWIVEFIFNLACVVIYIILQLILVLRTLDDRWPIGDIIFGTAFFVIGQVIQYGFSVTICDAVSHYIDGTFFAALCTLFAVMMVYKYWDSITKEDLEFSVGSKQAVWEVKESLLRGDEDEVHGQGGYGAYGAQQQQGYPPVPPLPHGKNFY